MSRKKRRKPYDQGHLKEIYRLLIVPCLKMKPKNKEMQDWIEYLFCAQERSITEFVAKRAFKMPGKYWMAPQKLVAGTGYRGVQEGSKIWVRIDSTMPDRIDIEVLNGQGKRENIFALTRLEYDTIKGHLAMSIKRERKQGKHTWEKL